MNTAGSRLAWSMARDRAFPWSEYFAKVSDRFQMPLRAMVGFIVLNLLTGLLVLGSSLAFYAIISGGGVALQVSYCVPILCVVLRGRHHLPSQTSLRSRPMGVCRQHHRLALEHHRHSVLRIPSVCSRMGRDCEHELGDRYSCWCGGILRSVLVDQREARISHLQQFHTGRQRGFARRGGSYWQGCSCYIW